MTDALVITVIAKGNDEEACWAEMPMVAWPIPEPQRLGVSPLQPGPLQRQASFAVADAEGLFLVYPRLGSGACVLIERCRRLLLGQDQDARRLGRIHRASLTTCPGELLHRHLALDTGTNTKPMPVVAP